MSSHALATSFWPVIHWKWNLRQHAIGTIYACVLFLQEKLEAHPFYVLLLSSLPLCLMRNPSTLSVSLFYFFSIYRKSVSRGSIPERARILFHVLFWVWSYIWRPARTCRFFFERINLFFRAASHKCEVCTLNVSYSKFYFCRVFLVTNRWASLCCLSLSVSLFCRFVLDYRCLGAASIERKTLGLGSVLEFSAVALVSFVVSRYAGSE